MRRFRSFIAAWLIGALGFAQGVAAAHACAVAAGGSVSPPLAAAAPTASPEASPTPPDCAMHAHRAAPKPANDCVTHCVTAQQANAAELAPSSMPPVRVALVVTIPPVGSVVRDVRPASPPPPAAAPPPRLRFARLLV